MFIFSLGGDSLSASPALASPSVSVSGVMVDTSGAVVAGAHLRVPQAAASLTGVVKDTTGAVVPGATVIVQTSSASAQTVTGPDGRFTIDKAPAGSATLIVRAGGFGEKRQPVSPGSGEIEVVVSPSSRFETVTVTPTRTEQRLGDIPASVSVLTSQEIKASPAIIADDVLRQVPSFSLFRRSSSIATHPTAQGVSLRGVGGSGAGRTLVLLDGVPFNDSFGGWVYWTRVPLASVDRIEITEDTISSLYGNYAMGGVINIVTSRPTRRTVELRSQFGDRSTRKFDFFGSDRWKKLGVAVEGSFLGTDGFPNVAARERGPIDIKADVKYKNVSAKFDYAPNDRVSTFFRVGYFSEDRTNAKIGETNDNRWTSVSGGVRAVMSDGSNLDVRAFFDRQRFHSSFLAVTNATTTRTLVRLSLDQRTPSNSTGGVVQWSRPFGRSHMFSAGADWRWVDGASNEDAYNVASPFTVVTNPDPWASLPPVTIQSVLALRRVSGGTQRLTGAFVQDIFTPMPKLNVTVSARVDHWRNYNGHNLETAVITGTAVNNLPTLAERTDTVVSPRVAALYHVSSRIAGWAALSSGFRAPTLNELYRQFRVGTTLVLAPVSTLPPLNRELEPERLVGGEAGVNIAPTANVTWRTTWFDNRVTNPVLNVTICAGTLSGTTCTPSAVNVTQQRQNVGKTRIRGVHTDAEYRLGARWRFSGGYLYSQAKVTDGGAVPALLGTYLQQVPKHRGSLQVAYADPKYVSVTFGMQYVGLQFDDDQNVRVVPVATLTAAGYKASTAPGMPGYAVADLTVSRAVGRNLEVFFGVQNLLGKEYFVGTLPTTIGSPRLVNGGVRVRFSAR